MAQKIAIVGGYGEMGRWFERFFTERGFDVTLVGRSSRVHYGDYDIVIIAVPIEATCEVIAHVAPQLKKGALLFDLTSVKRQPVKQMLTSAPQNVELVSVHPLFGPSMPDMEGQTIIVAPVRGDKGRRFLIDLFERAGAHVEELSPDEHDHLMSVIQGLTHFGYIAMGATLEALNFDIKRSRRFMSPVYEIFIDFIGRILGQNPRLYAAIQMNTDRSVHEAFLAQSAALIDTINARDADAFIATMKRAARHFGDAEPALKRSNKLIMASIKEVADFKRSIGSVRGLRNVYTGAVHIGVVKHASPHAVVLEEGSRETTLKTENVQLMSEDDVRRHRLARGERHRDFSVVLPEGANPETVARLLTTVSDVTHTAIIDEYPPRRSHTFRVSTFADGDVGQLQHEVVSLLVGIGCVLR
ncbi:MAG: prephenate dehydrogenase/arogenate dehydrogenase family protein [Euryarchaeota archaeon]|nr:prephenate dehydrogenase/arogenate dehydrogenase family protein [Euryarchaeota archaeon]